MMEPRGSKLTIFFGAAFVSALAGIWSTTRAFAYFGPTVDQDQIGTSLIGGSGLFLQTVTANGHVAQEAANAQTQLLGDEPAKLSRKALARKKEQERAGEDLSWMLGYAYYRSSAHDPVDGVAIYDEAHAIKAGFAWEAGGAFDLIGSGAYQVLPAENYSQGVFDLDLAYTFPLASIPQPHVPGSSDEAEVYYANLELQKNQPHFDPVKMFPNLRVGVNAEAQIHTKSPTGSGRTGGNSAAGDALTSDQTLNATAFGPDLVLHVNPRLRFRLAGMFYFYSSSAQTMASYMTIGTERSKVDLSIAEFDGELPYLLLFPTHTIAASGTFALSPVVNMSLLLTDVAYATAGSDAAGTQTSTFSVGGMLDWAFAPRWKTGLLADFTTGSQGYSQEAGGVKLDFAL